MMVYDPPFFLPNISSVIRFQFFILLFMYLMMMLLGWCFDYKEDNHSLVSSLSLYISFSLSLSLSMCVEMCYDVLPCVNGFLFRSFVVYNVPVSAFVPVLVLETNVMILTSNKRGKEWCSWWCLCMKKEEYKFKGGRCMDIRNGAWLVYIIVACNQTSKQVVLNECFLGLNSLFVHNISNSTIQVITG